MGDSDVDTVLQIGCGGVHHRTSVVSLSHGKVGEDKLVDVLDGRQRFVEVDFVFEDDGHFAPRGDEVEIGIRTTVVGLGDGLVDVGL